MGEVLPYRFIDRVAALPFVEAVYLFGSRARGDCDSWSDIDLAVSCPGASRAEWDAVLDIVEDADTLLMIDCVRLDEAPAHLRERVIAEGKLLRRGAAFERAIPAPQPNPPRDGPVVATSSNSTRGASSTIACALRSPRATVTGASVTLSS